MKKPDLKKLLKRFTIIDIIIIIAIVAAVAFAFIHIGADENKGESVSYDTSTVNKLPEKYLSFYREGKIVETTVGGYNSSSGKYQELHGRVKWVDDYRGTDVKILIDIGGKDILAGLYKDVKNADIYIEKITLETTGQKYENLVEIQIKPITISQLSEINNKIPQNLNYSIDTTIAIDKKDSQIYQKLNNELYLNGKKVSIRQPTQDNEDNLLLKSTGPVEIAIASEILGIINGETDLITIRLYGASSEDISELKNIFDVINVRKIN
ncbi:MAG: adhesin [Methanobrevibacter sp.]|jgi:ribosomal protein L21E|nr:adhesin [Methanobrevibacter sp.]